MRIFLSLALLFSFSVIAQESTEYKYEVESNKAERRRLDCLVWQVC
jgi:hypothetical protein